MRRIVTLMCASILFFVTSSFAQIIIQDSQGQDLLLQLRGPRMSFTGEMNKVSANINTKDESASLRLFLDAGTDASPEFHALEVKVKATDGVGNLFSNKQFTPGTSLSYTYALTDLFTNPKTSTDIDWFFTQVSYEVNQYKLFNPDTLFKSQLSSTIFGGLSLRFNYRRLIGGKLFCTLSAGYRRSNNFADLDKVEIKDEQIIVDSATKFQRLVSKGAVQARKGKYLEFDGFPIGIALTGIPSEDAGSAQKLKLGYSLYYTSFIVKNDATKHNLGMVLFITKADTTGVRTSLGGVFVEARDVFDASGTNAGLEKRLVFGLTLKFDIFDF